MREKAMGRERWRQAWGKVRVHLQGNTVTLTLMPVIRLVEQSAH